MLVNNTPYATAEAVLMDGEGREVFLAVCKASYRWSAAGSAAGSRGRSGASLELVPDTVPIAVADRFAGPPVSTGLLWAGDVTLPKPRVDVLIQGDIVLAAPAEHVDCMLVVGRQLAKTVRVVGDRHWRQGAGSAMVPARARPFVRMPIDWQRSFGGADPDDPSCVDLRNPVGRGMRRRPQALEGHPVPNFEDPRAPILDPRDLPVPVGWSALAAHWRPRSALAGTYDQRWREQRFPLLPEDFDRAFLNVAPADQQLERYEAGAEVRLTNFTPRGEERFLLPELAPPLTVVESGQIRQLASTVDTIVIEPAERRVSLVARAIYLPDDVEALAVAFLGPLSAAQRGALRAGRPVDLDSGRPSADAPPPRA